MVRSREAAVKVALASKTNTPEACQAWTRALYLASAVGDFDGDGRADAEDGWKSEPVALRHTDREPPRGTPVAYLGGSHDDGHRAISLGPIDGVYMIRSTDAGGTGKVATVPLDWPEKHWGLKYAGWSPTIDGQTIPTETIMPTPPPAPPKVVVTKPATIPTTVTFGGDLSHFQLANGLDLASFFKQGYDYVMLKCTQGTTYFDPTYAKALNTIASLGKMVAAYHFLEKGNADKQAKNLSDHIVDKSVPVYIDVERGDASPTAADWILFRKTATSLGLRVVGKYLTESYWGTIGKPSLVGPLVLWRAAYPTSNHDYGSALYPGNKHVRWNAFGGQTPTFWQFTSSGKIDGYSGNLDLNAFRGTLETLKQRNLFRDFSASKPAPVTPPVVVVPPLETPIADRPKGSFDFMVHQVSGNKNQQPASIREDMAKVRALSTGGSAVVFNTERESTGTRKAVSDGLGSGYTRVIENENTIAFGKQWHQAPGYKKPDALLLAKQDPSMSGVSGKRYLDKFYGENDKGKGHPVGLFGLHLLSEANCVHVNVAHRDWREKMWPVQLADVITECVRVHKAGVPIVLCGDFNTGVYFDGDKLMAAFKKELGDDVVHAHDGNLDHIILISSKSIELSVLGQQHSTNNASDHNMNSLIVRATPR